MSFYFPHLMDISTGTQTADTEGRVSTTYAAGASGVACRIVPRRSDGPFGADGVYTPSADQDAQLRLYGVQCPLDTAIGKLDRLTLYTPDGVTRACQIIGGPRYIDRRMIIVEARELQE